MIIKCKMCGGDIEFIPGATYGTCEYCGSTSTIPKADDENKLNRYNRANHFRRQCDFDKAVAAYEKLLEQDDTDSEAHWGAVLSRYGIEYVEDPATKKRIPTCHRVQMTSILADVDYKAAVEHAPDAESRRLYEEQAAQIAEIQKRILSVSATEKPYDVFICYKETDANGSRTHDSQWAQDVYYGLTEQGYKVFFARITLEDKLGQEYEPYIFAALNSAKVMVVIGSKPEYFNAVWVKNEWSRYLALMKQDRSRLLIPCYRDMDAYDLPDELSALQSQDMSKIGFMQDLIRGVTKVLGNTAQDKPVDEAATNMPGVASLLKRAKLFLEDGDFKSADEYVEKVLDIDPECTDAYLVKTLIAHNWNNEDQLRASRVSLEADANFSKAMRFANAQQKEALNDMLQSIQDNIRMDELSKAYQNAVQLYRQSKTERDFLQAKAAFEKLGDYQNAAQMAESCQEKVDELRRNAEAQQREAEERRRAQKLREQKEAAERAALHEKMELERKRLAEQEMIRQEEARRRNKKWLCALAILTVVALAVGVFAVKFAIPQFKYNKADTLLAESKYDEAIAVFSEIADWKDSESKLGSAYYAKAEELLNKGNYSQALTQYQQAGNYKDSQTKIKLIQSYSAALQQMKSNTTQARHAFAELGGFLDSKSNHLACCKTDYETAVSYLNDNNGGLAYTLFVDLGDYSDSAAQAAAIEAEYSKAGTLLAEGKYEEAISIYTRLGTYAASEQRKHAALLAIAEDLLAEGKYNEAIEQFTALNETARVQAAKDAQNAERLRLADEAAAAHDYATAFENYLLLPQTEDVKAKEYSLAQSAYDAGYFEYAVKLYEQLGKYELSVSRLPVARYAWANQLFEQGSYQAAAEQFRILGDFTDSADRINPCIYAHGKQLMESAAYDAARVIFASLGNYEDAQQLHTECVYRKATALMQAGSHEKASLLFASLSYADSAEKHLECEYLIADAAFAAGDYLTAQIKYESLGQYKDAADKHKLSTYRLAYEYHAAARYNDAQRLFAFLGDYEDSTTMVYECRMQKALSFQQQGKYTEALNELEDINHANREQVYTQCNMALAKAAEENGKKEEAIVFYGKAASEAEAQEKLYTFGKDFAAANQIEKAIETFYLAGAHAPSRSYLLDIGGVLESTGKTLQAYVCHIAADDNAAAYLDKLLAEYSCKAVIDALGAFTIQQDDNGMRGNILYAYSQALQHAGREQEAETVYALIKMHKEIRPLIYDRAVALLEDGKYDEAIAEFTAIQGYRDSADKIALCKKNRLISMYTPTPGMFVWDKEKDDEIVALEAYEVYYAGDYVKGSVLYPFLKLHNSTTSSKTVKVRLNIDGVTIFYSDTTIEAGESNRFYYSTYTTGTHTVIWYVDNIEMLNVTYTIQSGKSSEHVQMADAKAGNYITFGAYEQDNNSSNGKEPIEWLVLAREENKLLLLSRYALATHPFIKEYKATTWETSSVRQWLANDFINSAFSAEEQARICPITVPADKNPVYNTDPGNATQDRIFLLSSQEARTYFPSENSLLCWPTAYLKSKIKNELADNGTCWWWLRTPGDSQFDAAIAYRSGGGINDNGLSVQSNNGAIRPAMWIELAP